MKKIKSIIENKDNFFFFLLCLYPWFLISGPFLSDFVAISLSIYFIYKIFLEKKYQDITNIFFIIFCIFCLYIFLNSLFIAKNVISLKSSIFYFRFGLFVLAIVFLLEQNSHRLKYFFYSLLLVLFVLFVDSIFQKIFSFNLIGIKMYHSIRVSSFFAEELILGSYVIKILPITLAVFYHLNKNKNNFFSFFIISVSLVPIFLSAEKTALFMSIIFIFLFIINLNLKLIYKFLLFLVFFFILVLTLINSQSLKKRLVDQLLSNSANGKYIYSLVHHSHYQTAYKMFKDKPIFGHGPKMFRFKCSNKNFIFNEFSCSTHPHNFFLQLLSETGVVGALFFIYAYLKVTLIFFRSFFYNNSNKIILFPSYIMLSSILIIYLPFAPSGNIFNNWLSSINFFSIGIMIYFLKNSVFK